MSRLGPLSMIAAALLALGCRGRAAAPQAAASGPAPGRVGVHGMIVVGDGRIFLSHIPAFSPPHDAQVLLEVELSSFAGRPASFSGALFTLEPRPFSLDALMAGELTSFDGDVYQGSFENGGTKLAAGAHVQVRRVLVARHLGDHGGSHDTLFGDPAAAFVLRGLDGPGDVDQLVRVRLNAAVGADVLAAGVPIPRSATPRLRAGDPVGPAVVEREISCLEGPGYDRPCR